MKIEQFEWSDDFPKNDGDFFYSGKLPHLDKEVLAIVQVTTHPSGDRFACVFIPPGWRGSDNRNGTVHFGEPHEWKGEWTGPEFGLCCLEL